MNEVLDKEQDVENIEKTKDINNDNRLNIFKLFNWGWFKFSKCILGLFICSLAINLFIVPNNLYTGGTLGLSQLIRTAINSIFKLNLNFDISSIIYYLINIPLFIIAFKRISRIFFIRTLFAVSVNSLFLMIIPIPNQPIIQDLLPNVLIGGILAGIGVGMALSTGSSTGGTDIIGIDLSKRYNNVSVGNINLIFNIIVYSICGLKYGIETMLYSILFAVFETIMIDKTHIQNICSEVFIFTKKHPEKIIKFINIDLNRGATYWEATGGYTETKTYITYTVLSKYEKMRLERHMNEFDSNAFISGIDGVDIKGTFEKYLV